MLSHLPEYITLDFVFSTFVIASILAVVSGSIVALIESWGQDFIVRSWKNSLFLLGYSFPIALVAYIAGYLSSAARTSGVAQLLPAVLALMGALNIYVFGADNKYRVVISYCICIFAAMLLYGTQYGAYKRDADRESRLKQLIAIEGRLKVIRRNLAIGDDFPDWIIGSEPK